MIADQGDNLWIEDFDRGGEKYSWWNVYDTLGHSIARLHTPKGFEISEIGSDYVLGFVRPGGIQLLQLHTLRKPRSEE